jgi:lipopolysaccharide/colanic/teichoic acid biosynthesis glycosyltransferase
VGRSHTLVHGAAPARADGLVRAADLVVGLVLLALALPLMAVLAIVVRTSSHGPVLHREVIRAGDGSRVSLLSFRTLVDGGDTRDHARLRAVIGADGELPLTAPGRLMRRLRADRLPRLFNVVAGDLSLFS